MGEIFTSNIYENFLQKTASHSSGDSGKYGKLYIACEKALLLL